jgi:hypothetical protein
MAHPAQSSINGFAYVPPLTDRTRAILDKGDYHLNTIGPVSLEQLARTGILETATVWISKIDGTIIDVGAQAPGTGLDDIMSMQMPVGDYGICTEKMQLVDDHRSDHATARVAALRTIMLYHMERVGNNNKRSMTRPYANPLKQHSVQPAQQEQGQALEDKQAPEAPKGWLGTIGYYISKINPFK